MKFLSVCIIILLLIFAILAIQKCTNTIPNILDKIENKTIKIENKIQQWQNQSTTQSPQYSEQQSSSYSTPPSEQ